MSDVVIRPCTETDLPQVIGLLRELEEVAGEPGGIDEDQARAHFSAMQQNPEVYLNLVAEVEKHVAGFLSLLFFRTLFHRGGTAQINELVVTGGFRGQGIGGKLIQAAKAEALARGLDELEVSTEKDNFYAQHFYQKMGFAEEFVLLGMEFERS